MAVTGVSPTSGTPGIPVTITGSGFTGATGVIFTNNGYPVPSAEFVVNSDTQITAIAPEGLGPFHVNVFVPQANAGNQFTGVAPPHS